MLDPSRKKGLTSLDGALGLVAVLLVVQMWLLTAALESYLAGHQESAWPAAILSGILFLACVGLYLFVVEVDSANRRSR